MSVDNVGKYRQIKNLTKWHVVPFCYCKYATVSYIGMQIFNFVVLFFITPSFFYDQPVHKQLALE